MNTLCTFNLGHVFTGIAFSWQNQKQIYPVN